MCQDDKHVAEMSHEFLLYWKDEKKKEKKWQQMKTCRMRGPKYLN